MNLFLRPIVTNDGNDYKEERLQYFIQHYMNQYDILVLQEVFNWMEPWKEKLIHAG